MIPTLYYAGLRTAEKQLFLIDYQKCEGNADRLYDNKTAEDVITKYMEDNKKKAEEAERLKMERRKKKQEEEKKKLAPGDKKGEEEKPKEVQKDPKDMTADELAANKKKVEEERKKELDEYFTRLAKPKDRFEKLKMLQEFAK